MGLEGPQLPVGLRRRSVRDFPDELSTLDFSHLAV
jgi:hypothetical protein